MAIVSLQPQQRVKHRESGARQGGRLVWLRRWLGRLLVLLLAVGAVLFAERLRGQRALRQWEGEMTAKGERLKPSELWPAPDQRSIAFFNQLAALIEQLPPEIGVYAGSIEGIVQVQPGQCRRGSQEPRPVIPYHDATNTWDDLKAAVNQAKPALDGLRVLLRDPPPGIGYDIQAGLEANSLPNFVRQRRGAQVLQTAAMNDLHQGNLAEALEDLVALSGFARLQTNDPTLVNYMIQIAIVGLSLDATWDALQANGWTEPQLATLQQALQNEALLSRMPQTLEAERAGRCYDLNWFRSHTYAEWVARNQPMFESFGGKPDDVQKWAPGRLWKEYGFHPLWALAWADQEELDYVRFIQVELTAVRQAAKAGSWRKLKKQLDGIVRSYQPPAAHWRFYGELPMRDTLPMIGGTPTPKPTCPYTDFSKAWFTTLKNLTVHEMVVTAIAIKRYELRHGGPPPTLAALAPDFLPAAPRDLMDGEILRYRLHADRTYALYSVGADAQDDGGKPFPINSSPKDRFASPWDGPDWVWPGPVAAPAGPVASSSEPAPVQREAAKVNY